MISASEVFASCGMESVRVVGPKADSVDRVTTALRCRDTQPEIAAPHSATWQSSAQPSTGWPCGRRRGLRFRLVAERGRPRQLTGQLTRGRLTAGTSQTAGQVRLPGAGSFVVNRYRLTESDTQVEA